MTQVNPADPDLRSSDDTVTAEGEKSSFSDSR